MFYRQTYVNINLKNLAHNCVQLCSRLQPGQKFFAIVKANAYGHGATMVAQTLDKCGVDLFGVATLDEALTLRNQDVRGQIFVLDGLQGPVSVYEQYALIPVLHAQEELRLVADAAQAGFMVSLKIDTGMGRLGFFPNELPEILTLLKNKHLVLNSVISHLACADQGAEFVVEPLQKFHEVVTLVKEYGFENVAFSLHNSAATLDAIPSRLQWYRPGLALYGCYPHARQQELLDLQAVLEWKTQIVSLKTFAAGQSLGYGATHVTKRTSRIAVLPVGYADGYVRALSNCGFVLVHGKRAPVVGRVSMDLTTIDVTDIPEAQYGSEVTLLGADGGDCITGTEMAGWAKTISYEILCGISARVPRKYVS